MMYSIGKKANMVVATNEATHITGRVMNKNRKIQE